MKETLETFLANIDKLGGDCRPLVFDEPATEPEIAEVEFILGFKLPDQFREVLSSVSSHCEFGWCLPKNFSLPTQLKGTSRGELDWDIGYLFTVNKYKDGWITDQFPDYENPYDRVWHNKFAFQEVGNGDYLAIDLEPDVVGRVVYLSHDDGEGHGHTMANSFFDLMKDWVTLGCVGPGDWQWMKFCNNGLTPIDSHCDNAKLWYRTIGVSRT